MKGAKKFENYYYHLSTNSYSFELICFQRWFILLDFLKHNTYSKSFVYLDSDVLLFCDIQNVFGKMGNAQMTVCANIGPQYSFFKNIEILEKFCNFIIYYYAEESNLKKLINSYDDYRKHSVYGGICDMWLLDLFRKQNIELFKDLSHIIDGECFDHNINVSENFTMNKSIKKVIIKNKIPFGYNNGNKILFLGIHFQDRAKAHIPIYYQGKRFLFNSILDVVGYRMSKYIRNIIKKILPKKIITHITQKLYSKKLF